MNFQLFGQLTTWSMSPITPTCHTRKMIVQELFMLVQEKRNIITSQQAWGNLLHGLIMWMQPHTETGNWEGFDHIAREYSYECFHCW